MTCPLASTRARSRVAPLAVGTAAFLAVSVSSTTAHAQSSARQKAHAPRHATPNADWPSYGRDPGGSRWSPLQEITRENVGRLHEAWRFSTGEAGIATRGRTSFEATPLVVAGAMYLSTPLGRVFALDAATGRERWRYDAHVSHDAGFGDWTSRGVSFWVDSAAMPGSACRLRVVFATTDARLLTLDATDGRLCATFGDAGIVDLRRGLRNTPSDTSEYEVTSPPAILDGVIVVGSAVADNNRTNAASGEVRGYDARTGALRWTYDPVPQDPRDSVAYASWRGANAHRTGAANAWSVIAADPRRGLVFVPTSSPSPDYYGGERLGDDRDANSVVALRAATGERVWAFQTVHHDIWDYDNAAPPALITMRRDGRATDAVLEATKTGMLFVLDRTTGRPLVPVEERAVPPSDVPGEIASPTQPFSTLPSLVTMRPSAEKAFGRDSADRAACRATLSGLRYDGPFTPPSLGGTLVVPSNVGGAHWGGVAFDPTRQLAIVPVNEIAAAVQLIPRAVADTITHEAGWQYASMRGTPYALRRRILVSPKGVPCTPPPFGQLVAVNLETGTIAWRVPLGTPSATTVTLGRGAGPAATPATSTTGADAGRAPAAASPALGSPNLGGPIVTAGGLVFIAATLDRHLRAFDVATGRELWSGALPAGGKATPMTYSVRGRQYVAIAAGGDGDVFGKGDEIVVFALPDSPRSVVR